MWLFGGFGVWMVLYRSLFERADGYAFYTRLFTSDLGLSTLRTAALKFYASSHRRFAKLPIPRVSSSLPTLESAGRRPLKARCRHDHLGKFPTYSGPSSRGGLARPREGFNSVGTCQDVLDVSRIHHGVSLGGAGGMLG